MSSTTEYTGSVVQGRTRRQFLVATVGTAAGLLAVACSGASTSSPAAAPGTAAGGTTTGPATKGNVGLTRAMGGTDAESAAYKTIIERYTAQNANVSIDLQPVGNTQYYQQLDTRLAGGQGPAIGESD